MKYIRQIDPKNKHKYREFTLEGYLHGAKNDFFAKDPKGDISKAGLNIRDIIFTGDANFTGEIHWSEVVFENCYFENDINFYKLKFTGSLEIIRCFCDGELYIYENVQFLKEFNLIEFRVLRQIYVKGGTFDLCRWGISDNGIVKIAGGDYRELNIGYWGSDSKIRDLTLDLNPKMSGLIRITGSKSKIERFHIFKATAGVSISIEDISVNLLSIFRHRNDANFRITNLKPLNDEGLNSSEFSIVESYMGKAELYNIDFGKFGSVNIHNSHILDCSLVSVIWPHKISSFKGSGISLTDAEKALPEKISNFEKELDKEDLINDPEINEYYRINREAYRQLKFIYNKQGDSVNEQRFHAKELLAFNNTITIQNHFWTKTIIYLSHWFSDFGKSTGRPLNALLLGHFFLMVILIYSGGIGELEINLSNPSWAGFELGFEKYLTYINPLRKYNDDFKGFYIIFDIVMRIWSSYMIYNIIRASRRFIK